MVARAFIASRVPAGSGTAAAAVADADAIVTAWEQLDVLLSGPPLLPHQQQWMMQQQQHQRPNLMSSPQQSALLQTQQQCYSPRQQSTGPSANINEEFMRSATAARLGMVGL